MAGKISIYWCPIGSVYWFGIIELGNEVDRVLAKEADPALQVGHGEGAAQAFGAELGRQPPLSGGWVGDAEGCFGKMTVPLRRGCRVKADLKE